MAAMIRIKRVLSNREAAGRAPLVLHSPDNNRRVRVPFSNYAAGCVAYISDERCILTGTIFSAFVIAGAVAAVPVLHVRRRITPVCMLPGRTAVAPVDAFSRGAAIMSAVGRRFGIEKLA